MTEAVTTESMGSSGGGWLGHTFRFIMKSPKVVAGGTQARVTLKAGTNGFAIGDLFLGHASGNVFNGSQAQVKFGGSNSVSCAGGSTVTSDWINLTVTSGQALMASAYFSGTSDVARTGDAQSSNYDLYYKPDANDAGATAPSGFTQGSADRILVVSVEVQTPLLPSTGNGPLLTTDMLTRPANYDLLAGAVPTIPGFTHYDLWDNQTVVFGRRQTKLAERGQIAVFGDSGLDACVVQNWSPFAHNYSIGGDTLAGLLNALGGYSSLHSSRATVLMVGVNDIGVSSPDMATIKNYMMRILNWLTGPLVWIKITPTKTAAWNVNIADFNSYIAAQIATRPQCQIVDVNADLVDESGLLRTDLSSDNEHLNAVGAEILDTAVRNALHGISKP